MQRFIKNRLGRVGNDQRGFTLIEMLVVVGIIVALAAIIVPLVISFAGSGEEAAQVGERETLQTAIQSMMVDNDLSAVAAQGTAATATDAFAFATGVTLQAYMDQAATQFCYTWGTDGRLLTQTDEPVGGTCGSVIWTR